MGIPAADFALLRDLVRTASGVLIEPGKEYLAECRLGALAQEEGCASVADLIARLRTPGSTALRRRVVEAMTTQETTFFRDVHPFEALRTVVLPQLVATRAASRELTIWCAACSTGQEPYSVAMLVREHFPSLLQWRLRILATDFSRAALERAAEGRYSAVEVSRGLSPDLLAKYFQRRGAEWRVRPDVRRMVEFAPINLGGPWKGVGPADVVLMRNVLIYFDVPTKRAILERVRAVVRPGGWLFLGAAETTLQVESWERVQLGKAAGYRLVA